jgi:hypothetical protein
MPYITVSPGVMTTDGDLHYAVKASTIAGGITIVGAQLVNGAAGNAGTACLVVLQNYGVSGTVAGGTVGTCGGTADPYAADTPKAFTLTTAQVFIDAGEWLVVKKVESGGTPDLDAEASICIEYVDGVVTQG